MRLSWGDDFAMNPDHFDHEEDPFTGLGKENFDQFPLNLNLTGNAFEDLLGRAPSDKEKIRLLRIQKTLDIPDNDSIWMIFLALQYHLTLYEQIPRVIWKAAEAGSSAAITRIKTEAEEQMVRMRQKGKKERIRIQEDNSGSFDALKKEALENIVKAVECEIAKVRRKSYWFYCWITAANVGLFLLGLAIGWMI